ncbi:hypothetical protein LCGC14_1642430 [marine sediment metagenome]|uniref:Uncharacterized protein n=1 Tax=marine sediment metagenome TaxID=412755 RepID=A0A0F9ILQ3_9ZZZZ
MTDTVRYEAIGCGVYEVDPIAKPGEATERRPIACAGDDLDNTDPRFGAANQQFALATRIADALNGSEALVETLRYARTGLSVHAGHDPDCLQYIKRIDAAIARATPAAEEVG